MRASQWSLLALAAAGAFAVEPQAYNPLPNPEMVVVASDNNTRVTVFNECFLRVEMTAKPGSSTFEDRASLAFINRDQPLIGWDWEEQYGTLIVTTPCLTLQYRLGASSFANGALNISSAPGKSPSFAWDLNQGLVSPRNLLGTIRSLDMLETMDLNCTRNADIIIYGEPLHCVWSPYSQDGWHVVDDTSTTLLEGDWVTNATSSDKQDLYFFGHGIDYAGAIQDFVKVSGRSPLLPKFAMGIIWSRWYDLSFADVRRVVENGYQSRALPIDMFVLDMDWHSVQGKPGQEWTGWSFDRNLFQVPDDFWAWIQYHKLGASLNVHDADGVRPYEVRYKEFAQAVGADPNADTTIPAWFDDQTYMNAVEDVLLEPFQVGSGYRFAIWRDWQQGMVGVNTRGLNPTIWLNHASVTDPYRRKEDWRGWTLARYGGLGNQRYPTGFSGDVLHSWQSLGFQVFFTTTATSVGYQWSNDIVGSDGTDDAAQELHTRWVQWGAFSPLFRTHDAGMAVGLCADLGGCAVVELWNALPEYLNANQAAVAERQTLTPLWYSLNRHAFDTGLMPVRPMYLTWPAEPVSYMQIVRNQQYTIGTDLIVSPITAPKDSLTATANWTYWLPSDSEWYDVITGRLWNTSNMPGAPQRACNLSSAYDLSEIPRSVRAGAVIPRIPYNPSDTIAVARRDYTHLVFEVYPGGPSSGQTTVYEDDGETLNYDTQSQWASTTCSFSRSQASGGPTGVQRTTTVSISTNGTYPLLPASRTYTVKLIMSYPPSSVQVGGNTVSFQRFGCQQSTSQCWSYDGNSLVLSVTLPGSSTKKTTQVSITAPLDVPEWSSPMNGVAGAFSRAQLAKRVVIDPELSPTDAKSAIYRLQWLTGAGDNLSFLAASGTFAEFSAVVRSVFQAVEDSVQQVGNLGSDLIDSSRIRRATTLLQTSTAGWIGPL
jgi:alpha-glucosidase (family GH31 glycosyl hydrolase)